MTKLIKLWNLARTELNWKMKLTTTCWGDYMTYCTNQSSHDNFTALFTMNNPTEELDEILTDFFVSQTQSL